MPSEGPFALPVSHVPDLDAFICATAKHLVFHTQEIYYSSAMRWHCCFALERRAIPDLNHAVGTAANNLVVNNDNTVYVVMRSDKS